MTAKFVLKICILQKDSRSSLTLIKNSKINQTRNKYLLIQDHIRNITEGTRIKLRLLSFNNMTHFALTSSAVSEKKI